MIYVHLVIGLALVEYFAFSIAVARARSRYHFPAPATTGNEMFERYYRVQMNTLEQLVIFLPSIVLFGLYLDPRWAAGLGLVFILGRALYFFGYVRDPKKRELGFVVGAIATMLLLAGGIYGAVRVLVGGAGG